MSTSMGVMKLKGLHMSSWGVFTVRNWFGMSGFRTLPGGAGFLPLPPPPKSNHMVPGHLDGIVSSSSIPLHKTTYSACWLTRSGYQGMLLCCQKAIRDLIRTENATYLQEMVCTKCRPKVRSRSCQHMRRGPWHFPQHSELRSRIWQTSDLQSDVDYTNNQATWYIEVFVSHPFVFFTLIIHYYYN